MLAPTGNTANLESHLNNKHSRVFQDIEKKTVAFPTDVEGEVPPFFMSPDQCDTFINEKLSIHNQYYVSKAFQNVNPNLLIAFKVSNSSATAALAHCIGLLYLYF